MNSQENWQNPNYEGAIEVTTNILKKGCVVGCKICPQSILIERYQPEKNIIYLSFENFKTILGKIPKTYRIDFCGYAEPFLNKDCCSNEGFRTSSNFERFLKSEAFNSNNSKLNSFAKAIARQVFPTPTGPLRIKALFIGNFL